MKKRSIKSCFYLVYTYFKAAPAYIVLVVIMSILKTTFPAVSNVIMIRKIILSITEGARLVEWITIFSVYAIFALVTVSLEAYVRNIVEPAGKERIASKIQKAVMDKAISMDIAYYDDPAFYNETIWAMSASKSKVDSIIQNLERFAGNLANLLLLSMVFIAIDKGLLLILLLSIAITYLFSNTLADLGHGKEKAVLHMKRKRNYTQQVFSDVKYAKELRTSNVGRLLLKKFSENNKLLCAVITKYNKKIWILQFLQTYISGYLLNNVVVMAYTGYRVLMEKTMSAGDFVAVYNGVFLILGTIYTLLGSFARQFKEDSLYASQYINYMNTENHVIGGKIPAPHGHCAIEARDISFSYETGNREVIDHISFSIQDKQKIALVGYNGAGKTTLAKLLLRLYDVNGGIIQLNDVNIREYNLEAYRGMFGVVFQDYQLYAASVAQNVAMGNRYEPERIQQALRESEWITIQNECSCRDQDTPLLKEFDKDGIIPSVGQAQRIAVARILYQNPEIIILDEISSALDPFAESHLNQTLAEFAKDKTMIVISHRLSTTIFADAIVMMENGKIIEMGTHEQLLRHNGKYANMWYAQSANYANSDCRETCI